MFGSGDPNVCVEVVDVELGFGRGWDLGAQGYIYLAGGGRFSERVDSSLRFSGGCGKCKGRGGCAGDIGAQGPGSAKVSAGAMEARAQERSSDL